MVLQRRQQRVIELHHTDAAAVDRSEAEHRKGRQQQEELQQEDVVVGRCREEGTGASIGRPDRAERDDA